MRIAETEATVAAAAVCLKWELIWNLSIAVDIIIESFAFSALREYSSLLSVHAYNIYFIV